MLPSTVRIPRDGGGQLLINTTSAVMQTADGARRVSLWTAIEMADRWNDVEQLGGREGVVVPQAARRSARHQRALFHAQPGTFDRERAIGFPGRRPGTRNATLWVERETGRGWLEVDTTPNMPAREAAHVTPERELRELLPMEAVDWLAAEGVDYVPVDLLRAAVRHERGH